MKLNDASCLFDFFYGLCLFICDFKFAIGRPQILLLYQGCFERHLKFSRFK